MNFERDNYGNVIVSDENTTYTFIDMASYIGHQNREWYEQGPDEEFRLMFAEEVKDGALLHTEALVDQKGKYMRIMVIGDDAKRVMYLDDDKVRSDTIYQGERDGMTPKEVFNAYDENRQEIFPNVVEYLSTPKEFVSENNREYVGKLTNGTTILKFLKANEELLPQVHAYLEGQMNL